MLSIAILAVCLFANVAGFLAIRAARRCEERAKARLIAKWDHWRVIAKRDKSVADAIRADIGNAQFDRWFNAE